MLNFNDLICTVSDSCSFVGIAKEGKHLRLHLPKGFQDEIAALNTFEAKRDLFFLLYQVLRQFKSICTDKGYLEAFSELTTRDRDGIVQGNEGSTMTRNLDETLIFYTKLDSIGSLLDAYDELKISALAYHLGHTERIDLSQLHRYLDRGIFLPNGAVYVDSMVLPQQRVQFDSTDIVTLYCYLVREVKAQLGDEVSPEVNALAERFQQHYLGVEDSLFAEQSFDRVADILKESLDTIDQQTPLKDAGYDQFYEAIEQFLYGNWQAASDGEIWGLNNFYSVWESMCLTYMAQTIPAQSLLFLDRKFVDDRILRILDATPKLIDLTNTFTCNNKKLVPDAVVFPPSRISKQTNTEYQLSSDSWNDYGYQTMFRCNGSYFNKKYIRIAYIEQQGGDHTSNQLRLLYKGLLIDRPLPEKFYSYWKLDIGTGRDKTFSNEQWNAMRYFNHIFYEAIRQGLWTFETFRQELLNKLGVDGYGGVFKESLFRDLDLSDIREKFEAFVSVLFQFEVIDVKYLIVDYIQDPTNVESLKERSIRKQFVYEYLLHQQVRTLAPNISPKIGSHFWLSTVAPSQSVMLSAPKYLDGYLNLVNINFTKVSEVYRGSRSN